MGREKVWLLLSLVRSNRLCHIIVSRNCGISGRYYVQFFPDEWCIPYPYLRFLPPAHGIREADGPGGPKRHALIMIPMIRDQ